jgi:hypothetical protein
MKFKKGEPACRQAGRLEALLFGNAEMFVRCIPIAIGIRITNNIPFFKISFTVMCMCCCPSEAILFKSGKKFIETVNHSSFSYVVACCRAKYFGLKIIIVRIPQTVIKIPI